MLECLKFFHFRVLLIAPNLFSEIISFLCYTKIVLLPENTGEINKTSRKLENVKNSYFPGWSYAGYSILAAGQCDIAFSNFHVLRQTALALKCPHAKVPCAENCAEMCCAKMPGAQVSHHANKHLVCLVLSNTGPSEAD